MSKAYELTFILLIALLSSAHTVRAQFSNPTPYIQVTLDKAYYYPGDAGTVNVDIKDTLSINIVIYNLTITFPWRAYINGHWDGNQTINLNGGKGQPIASGSWLSTVRISFTTPTDSRYFIGYYYPYGPGNGQLNVWASGVGPGGGPGSFSTSFYVASGYFAGNIEMHTQTYILIAITVLLGIMTGAVIYYVRASMRLKRASLTAPSPSSPSI